MSQQQPSIEFGYPEFWPTVVAEYPEFFARLGRLQASLNSVNGRQHDNLNRHKQLLLHMLMLVAYGFNEVFTLVSNGMGTGAMKIVRNMLENAINAKYIQRFPEQAENYIEWHWMENYNFYKGLQRNDSSRRMHEPEYLEAKTEHDRVKGLFTYEMTNRNGQAQKQTQREWCRHNSFDRAVKAHPKLKDIYIDVMPIANSILHGSITGLLRHMSEGQFKRIPSLENTNKALSAAHGMLIITLEAAALALGVAPDPDIETLTDDYEAIWKPKPQQEVL